jgi:hypothetical protein
MQLLVLDTFCAVTIHKNKATLETFAEGQRINVKHEAHHQDDEKYWYVEMCGNTISVSKKEALIADVFTIQDIVYGK